MSENVDIFSLPGFAPIDTPVQDERLEACVDGTIEVVFYRNRPRSERTPIFHIYIGKEFGNQVETYAEFDNTFVTSQVDEKAALKDYRLLVESKDMRILPGNYVMRFFANQEEVAVRYLSLKNSLLVSRRLPPSFHP